MDKFVRSPDGLEYRRPATTPTVASAVPSAKKGCGEGAPSTQNSSIILTAPSTSKTQSGGGAVSVVLFGLLLSLAAVRNCTTRAPSVKSSSHDLSAARAFAAPPVTSVGAALIPRSPRAQGT